MENFPFSTSLHESLLCSGSQRGQNQINYSRNRKVHVTLTLTETISTLFLQWTSPWLFMNYLIICNRYPPCANRLKAKNEPFSLPGWMLPCSKVRFYCSHTCDLELWQELCHRAVGQLFCLCPFVIKRSPFHNYLHDSWRIWRHGGTD